MEGWDRCGKKVGFVKMRESDWIWGGGREDER